MPPAESDSREGGWFEKPKDFSIVGSDMSDLRDNASLRKYNINMLNFVTMGDTSSRSTPQFEEKNAQESQPEQIYRPQIPVAGDGRGSGNKAPQHETQRSVSEPHVTAIPVDPDPPDDSTMIADCTVVPIDNDIDTDAPTWAQIYARDMLMCGKGYPLYEPTPSGLSTVYRKYGIRVGDVGAITDEGAFDFMFNACQDHDQRDAAVNLAKLPDRFEFLSPESGIQIEKQVFAIGPEKLLPGIHVDEIGRGEPGCMGRLLPKSWRYRHLRCHATEGAALALPKGATLYKAMNKLHFRKHAACHAINWYKYMLIDKGRDISNGSLYFVTGCIKSINWGTAVFYARPIPGDYLRFVFSRESCQWDYCGKVDAREGPESTDIIPSDEEPNQCVFLSGYKVMLRQDIWNNLFKDAIAVDPSRDGEFPSPSTGTFDHSPNPSTSGSQTKSFHPSMSDGRSARDPSRGTRQHASQTIHSDSGTVGDPKHGWLGDVMLEELVGATAPLHPSDLINVELLRLKPEAKVAMVHDSEWRNHLPDDFVADALNPNIDGLLTNIKRSYEAVIENGNQSFKVCFV
ncbi:hypothetical protein F5887DRAFT_1006232 [Amanita rubescens]|nr:hypothetical protein F5887DRAFT_1006232 [Amanita rubescens]